MWLRICQKVRCSTLIVLILVLAFHVSRDSPQAQKTLALSAGHSKTGGLVSSKFRESITQFRQKLQPVAQIKVTSLNEQQVIEEKQQVNQIVEQQQINSRQQQVVDQSYDTQQQTIESHSESLYGSVKGTPGIDFPNYSAIPNTRFSCDGVPFEPGMYADEATGCQAYHLCYQGRRESFLCGVGTVFNQAILNCDFWHSVDCSKSSLYYGLNAEFGKSSSEPGNNWNLQSISQSSITQQQIPIQQAVQHQQIVQTQTQSSYVAPKLPTSIVHNEEFQQTFQQSSGGKVSPPKQQVASNFEFSSQSSSGTKSAPSSSILETQNINLQRTSGFVSPSRALAQWNGGVITQQQQQAFASAESSPMRSFASGATKTIKGGHTSQRVDSSSLIVNSDIKSQRATKTQSDINSVNVQGLGKTSSSSSSYTSKQSIKPIKTSLSSATKVINKSSSSVIGEEVWKPYFRSKTSSESRQIATVDGNKPPIAPVHHGGSSTTEAPSESYKSTRADSSSGSTTSESPSPTLAQPDHEPTFSPSRDPASTEEPRDEAPSVPRSSVPPTSTEQPASAEGSPVLEPSTQNEPVSTPESSAITTTASPETTAPSSVESPQTTTTAAPATEPSSVATDATTTTTAAPETTVGEVATTTTTSIPPAESEAPVTTTTTTSAASSDGNGVTPEEEKKKKRGVLVAGVDYVRSGPKTKNVTSTARTNSSSVVYANNGRFKSNRTV